MLARSEFEDIVLERYELKDLKRFKKHLILEGPPCPALLQFGLVTKDLDIVDPNGEPMFSGTYSITEKGLNYLEQRKRNRWITIGKFALNQLIPLATLAITIVTLVRSCSNT